MTTVKALFAALFLGLAAWMLARILPGSLTSALWALPVIVGGYYFVGFGRTGAGSEVRAPDLPLPRCSPPTTELYAILMVGAAAGGHDPLQPLHGASLPGVGGPATAGRSRPCRFV